MDHINQDNLKIASATEQQSLVVKDIDRNLDVIRQSAQNAQISSHQTREASVALYEISQQLQDAVNKLKI
ncbi:hypothetical protein [Paraglaciecola chathamensis]|uniref:Methyl-accepting chemotaxis protein n=1 Tax=Paraglaciecola agarilytica NO2 TaxID=1125747 RepID=A0ABQ0IDI8_9ALTE|nr:hypothetical protein [Paraglaciecola agarilytica]GAC07292.1 hypothetical protein GAGA_4467 [Paraglaciecola agarilytica NO2]